LVDIATSSTSPRSSDPGSFQYYGFANDDLTWAASKTGAGAGVTLTLQQLHDIYSGFVTNWSQVGGANAPITVYLPQVGSDTLDLFTAKVLGFDPTTKPVTIHRFQDSQLDTIPAADQATAIAPQSVAQWVIQANGVASDKRAGFFEGTLTQAGSDSSPVAQDASGKWIPAYAPTLLGAHPVYFVINTSSASYSAALDVVGFDATGPSSLCSGALASTISSYGFKPLPADAHGITCTQW
jgi:phosphate transport system substrate-binding protein